MVYLPEKNRKLVTAFGYYRALWTFFRWLKELGVRQDNPLERIKAPKPENPLPRTVTEEHFIATVSQLDPSKTFDSW
jgi:site-specific recombinase XerD